MDPPEGVLVQVSSLITRDSDYPLPIHSQSPPALHTRRSIHDGPHSLMDASSTVLIPNKSVDSKMVYALDSFAATCEGQANVVKGDSLHIIDDSNSFWSLVRVLKTHEVGYIPAKNISTVFERLASLEKDHDVDLVLAPEAEQDSLRNNVAFQTSDTVSESSRLLYEGDNANSLDPQLRSALIYALFVLCGFVLGAKIWPSVNTAIIPKDWN